MFFAIAAEMGQHHFQDVARPLSAEGVVRIGVGVRISTINAGQTRAWNVGGYFSKKDDFRAGMPDEIRSILQRGIFRLADAVSDLGLRSSGKLSIPSDGVTLIEMKICKDGHPVSWK